MSPSDVFDLGEFFVGEVVEGGELGGGKVLVFGGVAEIAHANASEEFFAAEAGSFESEAVATAFGKTAEGSGQVAEELSAS